MPQRYLIIITRRHCFHVDITYELLFKPETDVKHKKNIIARDHITPMIPTSCDIEMCYHDDMC